MLRSNVMLKRFKAYELHISKFVGDVMNFCVADVPHARLVATTVAEKLES
jgi:hypothetical protein